MFLVCAVMSDAAAPAAGLRSGLLWKPAAGVSRRIIN
jgi:hypothetical protein